MDRTVAEALASSRRIALARAAMPSVDREPSLYVVAQARRLWRLGCTRLVPEDYEEPCGGEVVEELVHLNECMGSQRICARHRDEWLTGRGLCGW